MECSPYLTEAAKRAEEIKEVQYIERADIERYRELGWDIVDNLGHHAAHAVLAIRRET